MKSNSYAPIELYAPLPAETVSRPNAVTTFVADLFAGWKEARAERRTRAALADLSDHILRDIGIADEEIGRIRALDPVMPLKWHE